MKLSTVLEGYLLAAHARRLAPGTIADYSVTFKRLRTFLGDPEFDQITVENIRAFLAAQTTISRKTLLNYHVGLSALWTWARGEGLVAENIVRRLPQPKPTLTEIVPFSRDEIRAMLKAVELARPYLMPGKGLVQAHPPAAARNRAIILLLLDTGLRAAELAGLHVDEVDLKTQRITVTGKGSKRRVLPISAETAKALWRYQAGRPVSPEPALFLNVRGDAMSRATLLHVVADIGRRAGVVNVHPHRFRHTFAIMFLRNGGNVFVLQALLGHSTLEMVRRYLYIVETDLDAGHRQASPVANWRL